MKYKVYMYKGSKIVDMCETNDIHNAFDIYMDMVASVASVRTAGSYNVHVFNSDEGTWERDVDIIVND